MSDTIAYTDEMLSTIFRRDVNTVRLALDTFEKFGMIEVIQGVITIPNWGKHQTLDKIEKRNEYMRNYMQEYRKKQVEQIECKSNCKVNNKTNVNSLEEDIEEEIEIDKENKKESKHTHGEYSHVKLKDSELNKLYEELGQEMTNSCIRFLDEYIEMKGYKAKSHYLCIKKWVVDAVKERSKKEKPQPQNKFNNFEQRNYDMVELEKALNRR